VKTVVVDASALAAIAFNEPRAAEVADRLQGRRVAAPHLLRLEMANVAWKKIRRRPEQAVAIAESLADALGEDSRIAFMDVDARDVLLIALGTQLSVYDASYLWLAGFLGAD
jgi:predicted nucleic acid-binding protein